MKFTSTITINKPKAMVAQFFADPKYLGHYQDTFISKELLQGTAGQNGAISRMLYRFGKKGTMELTETILDNKLPDSFLAQYHHKHTDNTMTTWFTIINEDTTRCDWEIHYTAFRGFIIKLMAFLSPKMFKKQVDKWLENFKRFVEQQ